MSAPRPRPLPTDPEPIHRRAAENLTFIRETMARATPVTAVPGWGVVAMGATALVAGWVAGGRDDPAEWLAVWLAEAVVALGIGGMALVRKAQQSGQPLLARAGKQFAGNFAPPIVAGILLTPVLYRAGLVGHLPGLWLLLYGTAVVTAGAFSTRVIPVLGFCFMALGATALFLVPTGANLFMMAGFGGLHLAFGLLIARRYGG